MRDGVQQVPLESPVTPTAVLGITEVAQRTGLSKDTLRYYEKAGLIDAVGRSAGGHRHYAIGDLAWLGFLLRLRATGMSIATMQQFAVLRRGGDRTIAERLALLHEHRGGVERQIANLRAHLGVLTEKIDHYEGLLAQQTGIEKP